jgi:hypothetical protein
MALKNLVFGGVKALVIGLWCVHGSTLVYYAKNIELYKKEGVPYNLTPCDILEIDQRARDRS